MARKLATELLVERLAEWGVDTVFGLPGDGINGLTEGLRRHQDKVRFVLVHHEEAAAFLGDGGLAMLLAELDTAVRYDLPVKVVVCNNASLGQILWEQMVLGFPEYGVRLQPAAALRRLRQLRSATSRPRGSPGRGCAASRARRPSPRPCSGTSWSSSRASLNGRDMQG